MNKNGNRILFPLYAKKFYETIFKYTRPGNNVSSTYTFCHEDYSDNLIGILLNEDPNRNCETSPTYLRDSKKDSNGEMIYCGGETEKNSGYKMHTAYFNVSFIEIIHVV